MFRFFFIVLTLFLTLEGKYLSFQEVHRMPRGVEKNYYIWRYIQQKKTSVANAKRIIKEASRINASLRKAYKKKTGLEPPKPKPVRTYSSIRQSRPRKSSFSKDKTIIYNILRSPNPVAVWKKQRPAIKLFVFNNIGRKGRAKLDHKLTRAEWNSLTQAPGIDRFVKNVLKEKLKRLKKALYFPPPANNNIGTSTLMKLGFLNLNKRRFSVAERYFASASRKAWSREEADRALFWAWKAGKNKKYLRTLANSYSINIYSMAGRDALGLKYKLGITPNLPKRKINFNIKDPIAWAKLKRKIFSKATNLYTLAKKFKSRESVGIYSYIMAKASRDTKQYFPMPYRRYLSRFPIKRQAIIYAIARQESKFIPASISSSFALGMMQIMPFLVKHLAKEKKELIDYDDMFNPRKALEYSNKHLDYLTKWLHHPLFVAYAYNAGIGFTRNLLKKGKHFHTNRGFEPWLSLERVKNIQANDYGKKVLANYVIYMNKLGYHIRLTDLVNSLTNKKITDEFRKRKRKKRK